METMDIIDLFLMPPRMSDTLKFIFPLKCGYYETYLTLLLKMFCVSIEYI